MKDKIYSKEDWLDCDGCNIKLEPVFWEKEWDADKINLSCKETSIEPVILDQINDGLSFNIYGGYGEFFDSLIAGPLKLNLCKNCCNKMFNLFNKTKNMFILESDGLWKNG